MYTVEGIIYTFTFEEETIKIESKISNTHNVEITSNINEDFSIFFLGGYFADDVEMLANLCKIDGESFVNVYLRVKQSPGKYIQIEIKRGPNNPATDPIDSGEQLLFIKDNIRKVE